ncbi:DUF3240 family protein [Sphingomonas flavalba]|uniref:DUF3240 family protein n=1 Tax=Sphingomonas flavalba TaxID=2559804 RepID=UPI0039DFB24E
MPDVMLTFYCAAADGGMIAQAMRDVAGGIVHLRPETVFGRDFSDACTAEQVAGQLDRAAVALIVPGDAVDGLVASVAALQRSGPVRWQVMPVLAAGRVA